MVAEACFSSGRDCPNHQTTQYGAGAAAACTYAGNCFHGTHVSGIAMGAKTGVTGVAPDAGLIAVQIFSKGQGAACAGASEDPCAISYTSDMIAGLNHVYSLRTSHAIASVNLSLGNGEYTSQATCDAANGATKTAIDNLRAAGIATVASAGNEGFDDALSTPACISSAVGVGASDDNDGVWAYSNSASFLSLLAPGVWIFSSTLGGGYATKTGTSMAAPHVTGAFAALRGPAPGATVTELLNALQATGTPVTDPSNGVTTPRLNLAQAVRALTTQCSNGFDDDGDGAFDWDGGPLGAMPDPQCGGPDDNKEGSGRCGLGAELALLLPLLHALRRMRRA